MKQKTFEDFEQINGNKENLYFHNLDDNSDNLIISLKEFENEKKLLKITFEGVISYRVSKELARLKTLHENPSFRGFCSTTNSEYLGWLKTESNGFFENQNLLHYSIYNSDNIIDIIGGPLVHIDWVSI